MFEMNWAFLIRSLCRIRSFKKTVIFTVVVLIQIWLALPVLFRQTNNRWPETFEVNLPENFEPPFLPIVVFSSYRPRYLEKTLKSMASSGNVQPTSPCLFILHQTKHSTMDEINETYKVLAKITFCRKLVWTFGNDKEERNPHVLKAHWWRVMTKVFEEKGKKQHIYLTYLSKCHGWLFLSLCGLDNVLRLDFWLLSIKPGAQY